MKIQYKERPEKLVFIWMSKEEGSDAGAFSSLKNKYETWIAEGYMPVVMESGDGHLGMDMIKLVDCHGDPEDEEEYGGVFAARR